MDINDEISERNGKGFTLYQVPLYAVKQGNKNGKNYASVFDKKLGTCYEKITDVYVRQYGDGWEIYPSGDNVPMLTDHYKPYVNGKLFIIQPKDAKKKPVYKKIVVTEDGRSYDDAFNKYMNNQRTSTLNNSNKSLEDLCVLLEKKQYNNLTTEQLIKCLNYKYNNEEFNWAAKKTRAGFFERKIENRQRKINSLCRKGKLSRDDSKILNAILEKGRDLNKMFKKISNKDLNSYKEKYDRNCENVEITYYRELYKYCKATYEMRKVLGFRRDEEVMRNLRSMNNNNNNNQQNTNQQTVNPVQNIDQQTVNPVQNIDQQTVNPVQNTDQQTVNPAQNTDQQTTNRTQTPQVNLIPITDENGMQRIATNGKPIYYLKTDDSRAMLNEVNKNNDKALHIDFQKLEIQTEYLTNETDIIDYIMVTMRGSKPHSQAVENYINILNNQQNKQNNRTR